MNQEPPQEFVSQAAASAQNLEPKDDAEPAKQPWLHRPSKETVIAAAVVGTSLAGIGAGIGASLDTPVTPDTNHSHIQPGPQLENGGIAFSDKTDNGDAINFYNPSATPSPSDITNVTSPNRNTSIPVPQQMSPSTEKPLPSPETH